ncbi:MAG: DUF2851 family protein [Ignavibacteriae bacterium]|nr:DUF2851 family protein [Ignavibacteriota bacterium]
MNSALAHTISETALQRGVHALLSEPSRTWKTQSGKQLQTLSPGRLNVHEGADFIDVAILLDGEVIIGNAEFHRKASDWISHRHYDNRDYDNLLLHLVFVHDVSGSFARETLVLPTDEVLEVLKTQISVQDISHDREVMEDLQDYSLLRLLRKSSEMQIEVNKRGLSSAFIGSIRDFLHNFKQKRRRPVYSDERLHYLSENIGSSALVVYFDQVISNSSTVNFALTMKQLLSKKLVNEGAALRREIVLNCFLPAIISAADATLRIEIFAWFWSVNALGKYGVLKRRFPNVPQSFLWQQQGLLEFIRTNGLKGMMCSEAIKGYGFAETLHFYRTASQPLSREVSIVLEQSEGIESGEFDEMD